MPSNQVSSTSAPFTNGIVIAFEDITGFGCYSALGKAPGFSGRAGSAGFNAITDFGVPSGWQLLSLGGMSASSCDGQSMGTIKHEFLHAMGFHHEHNRPDRAQFLDVDMDNTDHDAQFALMDVSGWVS